MDYNEVFTYKNGELFWKVSPNRRISVGDKAGSMGKDYYRVGYKGKTSVFVHRIIWEMHNGPIPQGMQVDHINQDKLDNRLENLRLATRSQNNHNSSRLGGKSKYKGVYKAHWKEGKWFAKLTIGGKQVYVGSYDCEEEAAEAINAAYLHFHGTYAHLNEFEKEAQNG